MIKYKEIAKAKFLWFKLLEIISIPHEAFTKNIIERVCVDKSDSE